MSESTCRRMNELSLIWWFSTEIYVPCKEHVARSGDTGGLRGAIGIKWAEAGEAIHPTWHGAPLTWRCIWPQMSECPI